MSDINKKISFSASDNGFTSNIEKMQKTLADFAKKSTMEVSSIKFDDIGKKFAGITDVISKESTKIAKNFKNRVNLNTSAIPDEVLSNIDTNPEELQKKFNEIYNRNRKSGLGRRTSKELANEQVIGQSIDEALRNAKQTSSIDLNEFTEREDEINSRRKAEIKAIKESELDPKDKRSKRKEIDKKYDAEISSLEKEKSSSTGRNDELTNALLSLKETILQDTQFRKEDTVLGKISSRRAELMSARQNAMSKGEIAGINKQLEKLSLEERKTLNLGRDKKNIINEAGEIGSSAYNSTKGVLSSAMSTILSGIGLASVFSIGGIMSKFISEGKQLDEARGSIDSLKKQDRGFGLQGEQFGVKQADFMSLARQTALGSGSAGQDLERRTTMNLAVEKAFGFETGTIAGMNKFKTAEKDSTEASKSIIESLNYFKKSGLFGIDKKDFTLIHEKQDFMNRLNIDQTKQMETVNYSTSTQIIGAFGKIDQVLGKNTSFSDSRQYEQISKINQSLKAPGNEFKQALTYRTLSQINPEADMFELEKMQEKGIFQPKLFSKMLANLQQMSSGNKMFFKLIKEFTGLGAESSETIGSAFLKNNKLFDSIGDESELTRLISSGDKMTERDVFSRGAGNVGNITKMIATIDNKFAPGGEKGIEEFKKMFDAFNNGGASGGVNYLADQFNAALPSIKKGTSEIVDEITKQVTQGFQAAFLQISEMLSESFELNKDVILKMIGLGENKKPVIISNKVEAKK